MTSGPPERLRPHAVHLTTTRLALRPMTEDDWPTLLRWNQDVRVLQFTEGGDRTPWTLEKLQRIYRNISQSASMFVVEYEGRAIGEGWVQSVNLKQLQAAFPGRRLFRIDLAIGEPALWGQGLGSEAIRALTAFAFRQERADVVFACSVQLANPRSERAFARCGYELWGPADPADAGPAPARHWALARDRWESSEAAESRFSDEGAPSAKVF